MLDNKWIHGKVKLHLPLLQPQGLIQINFKKPKVLSWSGIKPLPLILDPNVGPEIVLLITEPQEEVREFEGIDKTDFYAKSGLVNTSHGPVYWILFYFPSLTTGHTTTYECVVNPKNQIHMDLFTQLASQKYWHVIITDEIGEVVNFFEFNNIYGLSDSLKQVENVCSQIEVSDFVSAKAEYERTYTIEELLDA